MNISELSIRRPVLATVLVLIIILFGIVGYTSLGVREYPSVDNPIISVSASYPGANAEVIESIVFSQSLLWEITSKNNKVSYLYGTIHIQDKKVFAFDSTVINALNSCEAFAAELLLDEITTEASQAIFMKNNTIKNLTTNEQYRIIDSTCKASAGHGIMLLLYKTITCPEKAMVYHKRKCWTDSWCWRSH